MEFLPNHQLKSAIIEEDFRKLGLVLAGTGLGGLVIENDKITSAEGWALMTVGVIFWACGLFEPKQ